VSADHSKSEGPQLDGEGGEEALLQVHRRAHQWPGAAQAAAVAAAVRAHDGQVPEDPFWTPQRCRPHFRLRKVTPPPPSPSPSLKVLYSVTNYVWNAYFFPNLLPALLQPLLLRAKILSRAPPVNNHSEGFEVRAARKLDAAVHSFWWSPLVACDNFLQLLAGWTRACCPSQSRRPSRRGMTTTWRSTLTDLCTGVSTVCTIFSWAYCHKCLELAASISCWHTTRNNSMLGDV